MLLGVYHPIPPGLNYARKAIQQKFQVLGIETDTLDRAHSIGREALDLAYKTTFAELVLWAEGAQEECKEPKQSLWRHAAITLRNMDASFREIGILLDVPYTTKRVLELKDELIDIVLLRRTREWLDYLADKTPIGLVCGADHVVPAIMYALERNIKPRVIYVEDVNRLPDHEQRLIYEHAVKASDKSTD